MKKLLLIILSVSAASVTMAQKVQISPLDSALYTNLVKPLKADSTCKFLTPNNFEHGKDMYTGLSKDQALLSYLPVTNSSEVKVLDGNSKMPIVRLEGYSKMPTGGYGTPKPKNYKDSLVRP